MALSSLFDLKGRVAVITGAGGGIGGAFAEAMAEAGADVVCADIKLDKAETAAQRVRAWGRNAIVVEVDVTDSGQVRLMVDQVVKEFGGVDILFNNAGITGENAPAHELPLETWHRIIDVDLNGVFYCAREAVRVMIDRGGGKIVNTASIYGLVGSRISAPAAYAAAKGAVVNLTRELAVEYAPYKINVNCIAPGYILTEFSPRLASSEFRQVVAEHIPMRRLGQPEELKGAAIFLASKASDYITGQVLAVDGGWLAW